MTRLVVRMKILPSDAETNLEDVSKSLSETIPTGIELTSTVKDPVAFGLYSLVIDFVLEDKEGQMDKLEEYLQRTSGVGQFEVVNMSRRSVTMK
jgi:elongation factor 1-beta